MKTAIILHGMPSEKTYLDSKGPAQSNSHWLPWIQQQLLVKGVLAQTPEMPIPFDPEYSAWKEVFERFPLNEETILIGHSCGAGFILRYLSENETNFDKVVLVAPWIDTENSLNTGMFDFELDENLSDKTKELVVFNSDNDMKVVQDTVEVLKSKLKNIKIVEFKNKGHFCYKNMGTDEFPELLNEFK